MRFRLFSVWRQMIPGRRRTAIIAGAAIVLVASIGSIEVVRFSAKAQDSPGADHSPRANAGPRAGSNPGAPVPAAASDAVELSDAQLGMITVGAAAEQAFPLERDAIGSIDFNEDMAATKGAS